MKALQCREVGPPEALILADVPPPEPAAGQVVVAVKACGIGYPDGLIIQDKYQFKPERPFAPGGEVAGTVVRLGPDVRGWAVGDEVMAFTYWGGLAEEMAIDAGRLVAKPAVMRFAEATACVMTYGTALYALEDRAALQAGETLLVLGAAGGVGSAAIQIGKALGARVIAAASTPEKAAFCRGLGADACIDYTKAEWREHLKALTGGRGVDVIFDPVGGAYAEPALRSIAWQGRYLVVGFAAGEIPRIALNLILLKGCSVVGVFWGAFFDRGGEARDRHVARLAALYEAGAIRPAVSAVYPLRDAARAIRAVMDRQATGKIVVEVGA
ncbi:NADPH:quinone oxidoreductase family protein [Rhodopila globiformis]|uniref:NADPH:quinone oxidoreductase n=1 Tax=Rhodopila globiformis TaxID=1071 RepID=A0A2S6NI36_RHOGL|nr:NADPH:quinone oxidoreductase family protein [Rhodopila globiformis]PPQ34278.1 NADPH:quinone oxidoreductase [Rhodopila globiformis]